MRRLSSVVCLPQFPLLIWDWWGCSMVDKGQKPFGRKTPSDLAQSEGGVNEKPFYTSWWRNWYVSLWTDWFLDQPRNVKIILTLVFTPQAIKIILNSWGSNAKLINSHLSLYPSKSLHCSVCSSNSNFLSKPFLNPPNDICQVFLCTDYISVPNCLYVLPLVGKFIRIEIYSRNFCQIVLMSLIILAIATNAMTFLLSWKTNIINKLWLLSIAGLLNLITFI